MARADGGGGALQFEIEVTSNQVQRTGVTDRAGRSSPNEKTSARLTFFGRLNRHYFFVRMNKCLPATTDLTGGTGFPLVTRDEREEQ